MIQKSREFESQTRKAAVLTQGDYGQVKKAILDMAKDSVYSTGQVAAALQKWEQKVSIRLKQLKLYLVC